MTRLVERLRPWLDAVRQYATPCSRNASGYTLDAEHPTRMMWVRWRWDVAVQDSATAQLACQGLDLLALLALSDAAEWRQAVHVTWPGDAVARKWIDELPPYASVSIGIVERFRHNASCTDMAIHAGKHWNSVAYAVMRAELEERFDGGQLLLRGVAPICFEIEPAEDGVTESMATLLQIAMDRHFESFWKPSHSTVAGGRHGRPVFYVAAIDYHQPFYLPAHMPILHQLANHGVCLRNLWVRRSVVTETNMRAFVTHGPSLFAAFESVRFCDPPTFETIESIFSLLVTSSVHTISVIGRANASVRLLRWVFAACFSADALRSLKKLMFYFPSVLDVDFDVVLQGFIDANDTLSTLFPAAPTVDHDQETNQGTTSVSADTFQLTEPTPDPLDENAAAPGRVVFEKPVCDLRVLEIVGDWLTVVLPGWGRAWVHRQDALDFRVSYVPGNANISRPRHLLKHLVLHDAPSSDFLLALLRVVGRNVQSLGITGRIGVTVSLQNTWVREVFTHCSQLEGMELVVQGRIGATFASLSVFPQCYEDGLCRANRLILGPNQIVEDPRDFRIFECLADEHHAMFHHLQVLELTLPVASDYEATLWPPVKTMLERNLRLWHLVIRIRSNTRFEHELRRSPVVAAIRAHHLEPLALRLVPLDMKLKFAFLSVILTPCMSAETQLRSSDVVCRLLDSDATRRIFELAAVCRQRLVCVRTVASEA